MSLVKSPEMTEANGAAHRANGRSSRGPVTPQGQAQSAAANLRHGFYSREQAEAMVRLGENPEEFRRLMESLLEDLQPREGLEFQLVLQMGRTLWRMQRAERMQEGLALRRIQSKLLSAEYLTLSQASSAAANLKPYERLQAALKPRSGGPSGTEIDAFLNECGSRCEKSAPDLVTVLNRLKEPLEEGERKATLRQARALLKQEMEGYESLAYRLSSQARDVHSPQNYAALMAPDSESSIFVQRMEDANLRRFWRLTNTLAKVRQGVFNPKDVKNADRSGDVYENKDSQDIMTENKIDNVSENADS